MEIAEDGFIFSDDVNKLDALAIHDYLSNGSYWAAGIPLDTVKRAMEHSLCFGIHKDTVQVGFARWITDRATFGYLADVYVLPEYQGKGLMRKLMSLMLFHKDLQGLRRYMLSTSDAHGLYEKFGFKAIDKPENFMAVVNRDIYNIDPNSSAT
ncbi:N-acetyltransferase [Pedobacter quisquiliarum]|uniref:N-acetyltransferase n=1 Tax=Pedobacter quisquiliarum TaxID=1834438 RepID=A0A916XAI0_9SPHI|nr:GNAT family N-acetyltransferase [Pedobacter quisquiliarum]GGC58968.1 N-acetyltransferase [Pedobacter quisquiliarum]